MSPVAVLVTGIIGSGIVTIAGIFAVAIRRGPAAGSSDPRQH